MNRSIPVILDCDPGVDDALAIVFALAHPSIDLMAVCSVSGNGSLENTTRNAKDLLDFCGRADVPVYRGCGVALNGAAPESVSAFGDDGLGGCAERIASSKAVEAEPGVDYLVRAVRERPKEITLLAIGPLTNVARALREDAGFAHNVARLVVMGGSFAGGNVTPCAEYNFWADPLAAHEVFEAGFDLVDVVGLDVTRRIAMPADIREVLRLIDTNVSRLVYEATCDGVDENWQSALMPCAPMHDVLAVAGLAEPGLLEMREAFVEVVVEGNERGRSLVDFDVAARRAPNVRFAVDVDEGRFWRLFLTTSFSERREVLEAYLEGRFSAQAHTRAIA